MKRTLSPLLTALALSGQVAAWGYVGHEIVATIAQIHLHPSTVTELCNMLPDYASCHLAPIAAWADKIRRFHPWSSHMHYIGDVKDHPSQHCAFGENGWEDEHANVLAAIRNTTLWIQEQRPGQEEALKFLVHFLGDLHMPLHLTGRDRGGNDMKVRFDGRITNLHSVWDSRLIAKFIRTTPANYTLPLPIPQIERALRNTIYDPYIRKIMWEGVMGVWQGELENWLSCSDQATPWPPAQVEFLQAANSNQAQSPLMAVVEDLACPLHWSKPLHRLNCEIIWPPSLDQSEMFPLFELPRAHYIELDTPEYSGVIQESRLLDKLLAMGGIRLAAVLNGLYATEEEHGGRTIAQLVL